MTTNSSFYTDDVTGITFKRTVTFVWLGPQSQLLTSTEAPTQPGFRVFHASDFVHLSLIHTSWTLRSTLFDGTVLQIVVETVVQSQNKEQHIMCRTLQPLPEAVKDAIKKTNLAYLFSKTEAIPHVLKNNTPVSTHGMVGKDGQLIRGVMGSCILLAGTEGWIFEFKDIYYSDYIRVDDMDYPAKGATIYCSGRNYQFVTLIELAGEYVLAEFFKTVKLDVPAVIGKAE